MEIRRKYYYYLFILTTSLTLGLMFLLTDCKKDKSNSGEETKDSIKDVDGNFYHIVTIGNQVWMAENLRTTRYSDGIPIPFVNSRVSWLGLSASDKAYCYGDSTINPKIYGALYNWAAAMNGAASSISNPSRVQGACPTGWHLPSDDEWKELETYLGGSSIAGGKLKETGLTHWLSPNVGATNESGFSALPGGFLISFPYHPGEYCGFSGIGKSGIWWSSSEDQAAAIHWSVINENVSLDRGTYPKIFGHSVRCVRDNENITPVLIPSVNINTIKDITDITVYFEGAIASDGGSVIMKCGFIWGTDSTNLNFGTNNFSTDSLVNGTFNRTITHLSPGTKYYTKAYATNKTGTGYGKTMSFTTKIFVSNITFNPSVEYGNLVEQDGNAYKTVKVGNQTWMAENLKAITYTDGKPIRSTYNYSYVFWYNDDAFSSKANYGALYSQNAIYENSAKLCPVGWHVPTVAEWDTLLTYLGGISVAGSKMKETGTAHWIEPNNGATNESGFTALPGGTYKGSNMGSDSYFFSSRIWMSRQAGVDILVGWYYHLKYNSAQAYKEIGTMGVPNSSVRCIKN